MDHPVELGTLSDFLAHMPRGQFLAHLGPGPFLVFHPGLERGESLVCTPPDGISLAETWADAEQTTLAGRSPIHGIASRVSVVAPLRKSQRNPFCGVITVGRARTNDVRLAAPSVSKIHALLYPGQDPWRIQDNDSTNGTWVNGAALPPRELRGLASASELTLGRVRCVFLEPAGVLALCSFVPREQASARRVAVSPARPG
ncbi:MAG: FHA domain-containing protein [Planctomycetota bacterium]